MNRCPITYEDCGEDRYSQRGLRLLSRRLTRLEESSLHGGAAAA